MGFAIMSKDILYFFICFHTVFMAGFFYDLDTTVRFDGTAQKFVRLKTYAGNMKAILLFKLHYQGNELRYWHVLLLVP